MGWIGPGHTGDFYPIEEQAFSELTEAWNRKLYKTPSGPPIDTSLPQVPDTARIAVK